MSINIISAKKNKMPAPLLRGMYHLRYQVFNKRLHWDVQDFGELEIDQFDYQNPDYIIAKNHIDRIIGCWRLIPTTENHMLEEIFSNMLGDYSLPKNENIWELSRFAVIDKIPKGYVLSETTALMMRELNDFAKRNNITSYLGVTSVGFERLMKSAGVPIQRIGVKNPVYLGKVKSVLCLFPINQEFSNACERLVFKYSLLKDVA